MKKNIEIILLIIVIILSIFVFLLVKNLFQLPQVTINNVESIYYKNLNPLNLDNIVKENTQIEKNEKLEVEEIEFEYKTIYTANSDLPEGVYRIIQLGKNGRQLSILKKSYENDELISESIVANDILENSIDKIVEVGIGKRIFKYGF